MRFRAVLFAMIKVVSPDRFLQKVCVAFVPLLHRARSHFFELRVPGESLELIRFDAFEEESAK